MNPRAQKVGSGPWNRGGPHLRPPSFRELDRTLLSEKSLGTSRRPRTPSSGRSTKAERPCKSLLRRNRASRSRLALIDLVRLNWGIWGILLGEGIPRGLANELEK